LRTTDGKWRQYQGQKKPCICSTVKSIAITLSTGTIKNPRESKIKTAERGGKGSALSTARSATQLNSESQDDKHVAEKRDHTLVGLCVAICLASIARRLPGGGVGKTNECELSLGRSFRRTSGQAARRRAVCQFTRGTSETSQRQILLYDLDEVVVAVEDEEARRIWNRRDDTDAR
jgi:hypothetical protein